MAGNEEETSLQTDIDGMLGDMIGGDPQEGVGEAEGSEGEESGTEGGSDEGGAEDAEGAEGEGDGSEGDGSEGEEGSEGEGEGEEGGEGGEGEGEEGEEQGESGEGEEGAEGEGEDKDALIAKLRQELADKSEGGGEEDGTEGEGAEGEAEGEPEVFSVLGDADLAEVLDDPEQFNAVIGKAFEGFGNLMMKKFLTSIPTVVMQQVKQQTVIRKAVDTFYEENKDLGSYRKLVGATVNEVVAENPKMTMDKIFEEAAVRSRKVLGLKKRAIDNKGGKKNKNPSFAKPKGGSDKSGVVNKPTKLQTDIDSVIGDSEGGF